MINRVFGSRYRIIEKIGTGGMAEVFKAQDEVLNRTVAIKIMLPQYAADPTFAARFRQEAQAAANLQSPYIVNIYDWGQDEDTYYIAMEYVRGIDLKTAIERRGAINQRKVAEIGSQVCAGLAVAHRHDVIHRDIKPQNIMVQPDGNAKIMDFGIARAGNSGMTQTGSVLGTANYVSPEQAQGKPLTPQTDLYSLGIVLYEAATGKLPFIADEPVAVALKQVNENAVPPIEINPDIDPAFNAIIMKAMSKNTSLRYKDAEDMRTALNGFLMGRPVNGEVISGAGVTTIMGSAGTTTVMGAGQGTGTSVMQPIGTAANGKSPTSYNANKRQKEQDKKQHNKRTLIILGICAVALALITTLAVVTNVGGLITNFINNIPSSGAAAITVPNVVGKTQADATTALQDSGFSVALSEDYSETIPSGSVASQSPTANNKAAKGSTVTITISKGSITATYVAVPDLTGKSRTDAENALMAVGLSGKQGDQIYSSTIDAGKIVSQSPIAGTMIAPGTAIVYSVSMGTEFVSVPDVTGKTQSAAETMLKTAGFLVDTSQDYSSSVASGNVISQNITGSAAKGSTIKLVISKGPAPVAKVTVPSLSGKTQSDATSALSDVGLTITVSSTTQTTTVKAQDGTVYSQSPASGSSVDKGSAVTVILYKYAAGS